MGNVYVSVAVPTRIRKRLPRRSYTRIRGTHTSEVVFLFSIRLGVNKNAFNFFHFI